MINLVPSVVAVGLFASFAGFLALKLGSPPLLIIVAVVLILAVIDVVEGIRDPDA
jgi:hypothetical protein